MAEGVFDVVGEHPQEQHVDDEVQPAAMQERVGHVGEGSRYPIGAGDDGDRLT